MKTIYAFRHAKAVSGDANMSDHERPLAPRGVAAARFMGEFMKKQRLRPDLVLCSTASRTRQTLQYWQEGFGEGLEPLFSDKLYLASAGEIFNQLHKIKASGESALIIGHNPGLHQFSVMLSEKGNAELLEELEMSFPTAALAVIKTKASDWKDVEPGSGTLKDYFQPKKLFAFDEL